jgi:hypothetical protein
LGSGAFGDIWQIQKKRTGEVYAAKMEVKTGKPDMLSWEAVLIHKLRGKTNVPKLFYIGLDCSLPEQEYHIMVMDKLGPSLEDLFQ